MLNLLNLRFSRTRTVVAGMLLFALLIAAPFAGTVGASSAASLSGDDAYDPAAGGLLPGGAPLALACVPDGSSGLN